MFAFRKKNKSSEEIDRLVSLLKTDPENAKVRLKLADCYLRTGDKKSAIREYQVAARGLTEEGFNLKAISVYKKLSALDGMSLNDHKSLAAIYADSGLSAEARRTFQDILRTKPEDREALEGLRRLEREGEIPPARRHPEKLTETDAVGMDQPDPVPIENLLIPSRDSEVPSRAPDGLIGETLQEIGPWDRSDAPEPSGEPVFSDLEDRLQINMECFQLDPSFQALSSEQETEAGPEDPLPGRLVPDLDLRSLVDPEEAPDERSADVPDQDSENEITQPSTLLPFEGPSDLSDEDPNLHYHLGVAYREMDLIDRAIEEFTQALDQGIKPLECLTMLSRCYLEKGLFQEAAECIDRALRFENLAQDQIDTLHRLLEEAEAVGKLG